MEDRLRIAFRKTIELQAKAWLAKEEIIAALGRPEHPPTEIEEIVDEAIEHGALSEGEGDLAIREREFECAVHFAKIAQFDPAQDDKLVTEPA